jgi:hypothetical protein
MDPSDVVTALALGISAVLEAVAVAKRVGCAAGDVWLSVRVRAGSPTRVRIRVGVVERPLLGELRRRLRADRSLRADHQATPPTVFSFRVAALGDGFAGTMGRRPDHGVHGAS